MSATLGTAQRGAVVVVHRRSLHALLLWLYSPALRQ